MLGTSTRTVQRWIASGRLPAHRIGARWRVAIGAFDALVTEGRTETKVTEKQVASPGQPRQRVVRPIQRLFIANRGEIARRIRRTATRLGIDVIEPVIDGPNAIDLLDAMAVTEAAQDSGADAVHPGFGFLAENAEFAAFVEGAGMAWVGPPPHAIRSMGDKAAARRLAAKLGVPVVPGYDGDNQSDRALRAAAKRIGYPLLVKPSAGGGGKGMHVVRDEARLADALASARREAKAAFGDERLILERWIEGPRHVEVQVLFDAFGTGVHLGERDCSTQRRHQKVLEEAPSPAVTKGLRKRLTGYALELAAAVGYRNAGTCEFLLTDRGEVYFLEMNTRLQVEHPVTEEILGLDHAEPLSHNAAGRPLDITQPMIDILLRDSVHAVEVRLYAEDAEHDFLPATGRIERLVWPGELLDRVDAGVDEGTEVGARFDPMLAKIVARGATREAALIAHTEALDRTVVLGLTTNLRFLRWLVRQPAVRRGQMRIDTLGRIWPPDDWAERAAIPDEAWQAAARALSGAGWQAAWRLNGAARVRLAAEGETRSVAMTYPDAEPGPAIVVADEVAHVDVAGRSIAFSIAPAPDVDRAARAATAHHGGGSIDIVAPMPGAILAVHTSAGAPVGAGDSIVTLEAMKMEHAVIAPIAGRVAELRARTGDQVARGDVLAVVEP
jgi:acetyl-CoA/propionyl-CoA carboxylase biotin carboxyl carrier protein